MPAYVMVTIEVTDAVAYEDYKKAGAAAIARHGGRYLVRGGRTRVVEGEFPGSRFVLLEFPDYATAEGFVASEEYVAAKALRAEAAVMSMVILEGYVP